jgi:hypothetical protein
MIVTRSVAGGVIVLSFKSTGRDLNAPDTGLVPPWLPGRAWQINSQTQNPRWVSEKNHPS